MVESWLPEAVKLCLENWTAMKLAIDMGWGDPIHKENLEKDLTNYILSYDVTKEDIAQFLDDNMEDRFSVILDDGSSNEIAAILLKVFEESSNGVQDELNKLRSIMSIDTSLCKKVKNQPDIVTSMQNLDLEPPQLVSNIDDDGFETVVSKKNKKNK